MRNMEHNFEQAKKKTKKKQNILYVKPALQVSERETILTKYYWI